MSGDLPKGGNNMEEPSVSTVCFPSKFLGFSWYGGPEAANDPVLLIDGWDCGDFPDATRLVLIEGRVSKSDGLNAR